jgi:hypothetical protein
MANVTTAGALIWFVTTQPSVRVVGSVGVHGSVSVDGGTLDVKFDKNSIQKVQICEEGYEYSSAPLTPDNKRQMVPTTNCASLDTSSRIGGYRSYGLSVVPARTP